MSDGIVELRQADNNIRDKAFKLRFGRQIERFVFVKPRAVIVASYLLKEIEYERGIIQG